MHDAFWVCHVTIEVFFPREVKMWLLKSEVRRKRGIYQ